MNLWILRLKKKKLNQFSKESLFQILILNEKENNHKYA